MLSFDDSDNALVQTCDFITPNVDEGYFWGRIAAANSLSDIYAMNGDAFCAMNILGVACKYSSASKDIMQGALDTLNEAGVALAGGHSISSSEPFFGLSVSGFVKKHDFWANNTAQDGDAIIITKPIGSGILCLGMDLLQSKLELYENMCRLNLYAQRAAKQASAAHSSNGAQQTKFISAATDITGFGLLGHLFEMSAGNLCAHIYFDSVPCMSECRRFFDMGVVPASAYANYEFLAPFVECIDHNAALMLSSPETSGGLMFATAYPTQLLRALNDSGIFAKQIGYFVANKTRETSAINSVTNEISLDSKPQMAQKPITKIKVIF